MGNFKIVVTGSRCWPMSMKEVIAEELQRNTQGYWFEYENIELYHGACPYGVDTDSPYKGVDGHCDALGREFGWEVHPIPAKASTGFLQARDFAIRNQKLIDTKPDLVIAFFLNGYANRGTAMTVQMARRRGLSVEEIRRDEF